MASFWTKLDAGLAALYSNWLQVQQHGLRNVGWVHPAIGQGATGAQVRLRYEGPLADIERTGFETTSRGEEGHAFGIVRFDVLPKIAAHPGVRKLSYGTEGSPLLDRTIPYVRANWVRTYEEPLHDYDGYAGRDVVLAILDTGLDIGHDFLQHPRASDGDEHRTRILRLWDPGLVARDGETSPRSELLGGRAGYGVEYTDEQINNTLNGRAGVRVRHRDCSGHGTHVASIAAGNGGRARRYVGMAPLAHIIGVKMLYLEHQPMKDDTIVMSYEQRFVDALDYVFNVVRLDLGDRRVVINYSVGDSQGPHDGLSQQEEDLNRKLQEDPRRVFVAAAGNSAGAGYKAKMTIPTSGTPEIRLPFHLYDDREPSDMTKYSHCFITQTAVYPMQLEIWYAAPPAGPVGGSLRIQGVASPIALPQLGDTIQATQFGQGQMYKIVHGQDLGEIGSVRVLRNYIRLQIFPFRNLYHLRDGVYEFTLTGAPGQVLYAWGATHSNIVFRPEFFTPPVDSFESAGEISIPAGADSVIAVANYKLPDPTDQSGLGTRSSHGPLVAYNPAAPPRPAKPDIAAPGHRIVAARSRFATRPGSCVDLPRHDANQPMGGTSMASPHVAGLVALMLEKNRTLTLAQIRASFRVLEGIDEDADAFGIGIIDADATVNAVPTP